MLNRRDILPVVVLAIVGAVVFAPTWRAQFIFDDHIAIKDNAHIRSLTPIDRVLTAPPQNPVAGRPVVGLSLALNYALHGLRPAGYHLFNQICHILAAIVLYLFVRDVTRRSGPARTVHDPPECPGRPGPATATTAPRLFAFIVALLWLVHPLQSETVAYAIQRTELLMGLFYLLTLWCAWRGFMSPRGGRVWLVAAVVACALGMGSKEVMVSAPLCVWLMDRALASGSFGEALRRRRWFYASLAATWLILLWLVLPGPRSESAGFGVAMSPWHYLLTQAEVIVHYLRLIVWPHPLLIAYDWPIARTIGDVWPQGLVIVALLTATAWALWRRPVVGWLAATAFMVLAPTSSFVPITTEVVAERRMYLVLAPLIVLTIGAAARHLRPRAWVAGALLIALVCSVTTFVRTDAFREPRDLWHDVLEHYPMQKYALANIGLLYMNRGDYETARAYFEQVVTHYPDHYGPLANYGSMLVKLGEVDEGERHLRAAIEVDPDRPEAYYNLGRLLAKRGDDEQAAAMFERTIRCEPDSFDAWYELGSARHRLRQLDEAIVAYRQAVQRNPHSARLQNDLGVALALSGQIDQAARAFETALTINPTFAEARHNLEQLHQRESR